MKRCRICGELLPHAAFYRNTTGADGLRTECKDCKRAIERARYQSDRGQAVARAKNQRAKANGKRRARDTARNAARRGIIQRQPCEVCGRTDVHAHHEDYARPLDVRWLCPAHHGEIHRTAE